MSETALRIGAVSYLNSKPLVEGLVELLPDTEIRLDYPSRLADDLTSGELDVALIPSIEYFRGQDYLITSDACVAAHGPVLSVKLYSRVPWSDVRTLALDEGSRTSATLARILLSERFGVQPELQPLPIDHRTEDTTADAILLIGDRAILPPKEKFLVTWDLGQEWFEWTGLPFVFAMWVANDGVRKKRLRKTNPQIELADLNTNCGSDTVARDEESAAFEVDRRNRTSAPDKPPLAALDILEKALEQSRDWGVARLDDIARREAPLLGLSMPTTFSYLSENLQYHLGSAERSGIEIVLRIGGGSGPGASRTTIEVSGD